jgi:hypothetical protein
MDILYQFVDKFCKEHNIDSSHDVTHSRDCVAFVVKLFDRTFSDQDKEMAIYAAALHDCVDKKYVDVVEASQHILGFLTSIGWSEERAQDLLNLVTTMSYSKLNDAVVDRMPVFPEHGELNHVYHAVRQADLLCSYHVHRCYQYQKRIHPEWDENTHWLKVEDMFQKRMFKYVTNHWFMSRVAMALIPPLIEQAKKDLAARNGCAPANYGICGAAAV